MIRGYRVWDNQEKTYSDKAFSIDQLGICYVQDEDGYWEEIDDSRFIVEFETGLTDKNGKKIYEGDIVKQLMYTLKGRECNTTWVVKWNNDEFCYDLHRVSGALYGDSMLSTCESKDCEVVGNIHENPELLGGEE